MLKNKLRINLTSNLHKLTHFSFIKAQHKEPNYANFFNYYDMETVDGISYCKILRLIQ